MNRRFPLRGLLGERARQVLRPARHLAIDTLDLLLHRRQELVPPRSEVEKIGGYDFLDMGRHLATVAREVGGLLPHERVLDVGCGLGRFAVALRDYLQPGEYAGFDVYRRGVDWCRREIESRLPNFHFTFVDVMNRHYNPKGSIAPEDFVFPYASNSVDLVFASSVFTHLTPATADHYLAEIRRVLKPGGRFLSSFFLLNEHSRAVMARTNPSFVAIDEIHAAQDPEDVEAAVAFDEIVLRAAAARHGIPVAEIHYGAWSYRSPNLSYQDFVLARKEPQ